MSRSTVLITGDCQALEMAAAAYATPALAERFEFVHLNGSGFGDKIEVPTADQLARAVAHWRQDTPSSPAAVDSLARHLPRLTFPTLALGVYLPFQVFDPLRPDYTWMGDRVLMTVEERGLAPEAIPRAYHRLAEETLPGLRRLAAAQILLLEQAEEGCDIRPADFMAAEMFSRRLFWDYDHAAPPMIGWLLGQAVRMSWPQDHELLAVAEALVANPGAGLPHCHPWQAPIPKAARERMGLDWAPAHAIWKGQRVSEDDYLIAYALERRAVRSAMDAPEPVAIR